MTEETKDIGAVAPKDIKWAAVRDIETGLEAVAWTVVVLVAVKDGKPLVDWSGQNLEV